MFLTRNKNNKPERSETSQDQNMTDTTLDPAALSFPELSDDTYSIDYFMGSLNGDLDAVRMLLAMFIHDHSLDVLHLKQMLPESLDDARHIVHRLKGVSGSIGAKGLHDIATTVDNILKAGKVPSQEYVLQMECQMAAVVNTIELFLQSFDD